MVGGMSILSQHLTDAHKYNLQHHSIQYPTISRIAKDYLAIQGSAVASERSFSSGGITGTARRNCLLPKTFEALQLLKSAYCQGHVSATTQAEFTAARIHHNMEEV